MTRHGPTWPRAEAIALRPTGPAVLEAGHTELTVLAGDILARDYRGTTSRTAASVHKLRRDPVAARVMSGNLTSKSP